MHMKSKIFIILVEYNVVNPTTNEQLSRKWLTFKNGLSLQLLDEFNQIPLIYSLAKL